MYKKSLFFIAFLTQDYTFQASSLCIRTSRSFKPAVLNKPLSRISHTSPQTITIPEESLQRPLPTNSPSAEYTKNPGRTVFFGVCYLALQVLKQKISTHFGM